MDIGKLLAELRAEKDNLDRAIRALELVASKGGEATPQRRPGRKGMSPEERLAVSERMLRYWAARKGKPAARKARVS